MSTLKIEPFDGPAATVVGGSSADDPWSREVMELLAEAPVAAWFRPGVRERPSAGAPRAPA